MRYTRNFVVIFIVVLLSACGGGGDDGTQNNPAPATAGELVASMESSLNNDDGQIEHDPFGLPGISSIAFDAYALCMPADPLADPVIPAVAPDNVLGCENTLALTYRGSITGNEIRMTATIPDFVIHYHGTESLGGDFKGYLAYSDVAMTITYGIIANADGTYSLDGSSPPGVDLTLTNPVFDTDSDSVDALGNLLLTQLEPYVRSNIKTLIQSALQEYVNTEAPDFVF